MSEQRKVKEDLAAQPYPASKVQTALPGNKVKAGATIHNVRRIGAAAVVFEYDSRDYSAELKEFTAKTEKTE
jgi:hypothetical protein